ALAETGAGGAGGAGAGAIAIGISIYARRTEGILLLHLPIAAFNATSSTRFFGHRLQRFFVQAQIRYQLPQPRVLVPQLLCLLGPAYVHAAILCLPAVDRVLRDAFLPRNILHCSPRFDLL